MNQEDPLYVNAYRPLAKDLIFQKNWYIYCISQKFGGKFNFSRVQGTPRLMIMIG